MQQEGVAAGPPSSTSTVKRSERWARSVGTDRMLVDPYPFDQRPAGST